MGKEWYWGGKSSKRSGNVDRHMTTSSTSAGCMCAVFQLFDFHQFQFTGLNQPQPAASSNFKPAASTSTTTASFQLPEEANIPKGVEAPRNSLKSEEGISLSSIIEEEDQESLNLIIPMGIQIKTTSSRSGLSPNDFSSDTSSNSPGTKTPSLVARLMGLDLLPETNSPTNFSSSSPSTTIHAAQRHHHLSRSHTQPLRSRWHLANKARHLLDGDMTSSGTRSLPETPRISSARRSDVDLQHHRLSLQINKENVEYQTDVDFSKLSALRRKHLRVEEHDQSSRSPSPYARQIVKQVKESVSRKVGLDITNTVRNKSENNEILLFINQQLKAKRSVSKGLSKLEEQASRSASTSSTSASSCSPRRIRFTETKTSTSTTTPLSASPKDQQSFEVSTVNVKGQTVKASAAKANTKGKVQALQEQNQKMSRNNRKSGGGGGGREGAGTFGRRMQKMQEETFVRPSTANCRTNIPDKKCKKTPLSNDILHLNVVPTLLPVKKSSNSPPSSYKRVSSHQQAAAKVPGAAQESKRSSQLSSSQSQKYQHPEPSSHVLHTRDFRNDIVHVPNDSTTTAATIATVRGVSTDQHLLVRHYITRILACTGIANTSHVSFTSWFSPSRPLDPSIFHRLEISSCVNSNNNGNLSEFQFRLRSNRKLLFDIVDEILAAMLRPYINLKPWINTKISSTSNYVSCNYIGMQGSELIDILCSRIQSFPCTDCQVLEDIDALIDKDLPLQLKIEGEMVFEEEGEGLVMEIERDIVDTLVHETTLILVGTWE